MAGLTTKLTIPVVLIATMAIGLTAFLNLGKFDRTLGELETSRARFTINEIHATLEMGLGLGLPLRGLANAQGVVEYEIQRNPAIVAIVVHDEQGEIVFHAGFPMEGDTVPASWRPYISGARAKSWSLRENDEQIIGAGLTSVIGAQVGGVALRYSLRDHNRIVAEVGAYLRKTAGIGILLTALVAIAGISLLIRNTTGRLKRIERSLVPGASTSESSESTTLAKEVVLTSQAALRELSDGHAALSANATPTETR